MLVSIEQSTHVNELKLTIVLENHFYLLHVSSYLEISCQYTNQALVLYLLFHQAQLTTNGHYFAIQLHT